MSDPNWQHYIAAEVTAWVMTNKYAQLAIRNIPSWVNVTNAQLVLMATQVVAHEHPGPVTEQLGAALPEWVHTEEPTTEEHIAETVRYVGEVIEMVKQEVPLTPDTSIEIGGEEVEAQVAEIKALQADHEATLQMLKEDLNSALKERANTDAALAENILVADLGPGGQKMLDDAQAANQQQIKDNYAAEEANLRRQQDSEMAALQTKQVGAQNRDDPPPSPSPPTRSL